MPLARTNAANLFAIGPDDIVVDPDFNPRDMTAPDTVAWIGEIAASIRERGFDGDRPLLGRISGDKFIVTDGHCRLAAVRMLLDQGEPILTVQCRSEPQATTKEDRQLLSLRAPGKALTRLESAVGIKRLISWGWAKEKIASRLGKSRSWLEDCLALAGADPEVREAVTNGHIGAAEATSVVRKHKEEAGAVIAAAREAAQERGKTRATGRDVAAVTRLPRHDINALARTVVCEWLDCGSWEGAEPPLRQALNSLAAAFPNLNRKAA